MLDVLTRFANGVSWCASQLASVAAAVLTVAMVYEVAARYVFDAPTAWAFDIAYMANGAVFLLGVAYVLREDAHIRIDVLRNRLPVRFNRGVQGIAYLLILAPFFGMLSWIAVSHTWRAWVLHEVETVSPWAPLMWPFYLCIALGLIALTLQLAVGGLRAFRGLDSAARKDH
ncbi:TRAP transporter small permease subunit [Castellaniella defragrans]|jgi:TRAP-type C4-dicarboxylate transport system permease small subunit|uniref:TRAP transporter small permease protein n=1 Tax=Castellaniella defragrans TaxID=75697 RepID=A0A7W9TPJ9_CASDE|nr:TRAP transporter small permease [Castellaniella defragrans]KAB0620171.1 TRAP transporter small permease [Castellaniella defragrans]MBB6084550.1 TRAP-type C4-dicarboxylate transport system permease small subunit [Castellaniella defragrans]